MITQGAYVHLLMPGIRWLFFCHYYPKRRPNQNGSRYYRKRRQDYEAHLKTIPAPDDTD